MKRKTETSEAIAFMDWCNRHPRIGKLMVHIANERKCSLRYGNQLKRMGVRPGFPDYFLPYSSYDSDRDQFYFGLFIELKKDIKSKITDEQIQWIDYFNSVGFYVAKIAYGADEAIAIVKKYLQEV